MRNVERLLLTEAGYAKGFEAKIITHGAWELEVQIMSRMLEVIGLKVKLRSSDRALRDAEKVHPFHGQASRGARLGYVFAVYILS